jgi:hypothetical protein
MYAFAHDILEGAPLESRSRRVASSMAHPGKVGLL